MLQEVEITLWAKDSGFYKTKFMPLDFQMPLNANCPFLKTYCPKERGRFACFLSFSHKDNLFERSCLSFRGSLPSS